MPYRIVDVFAASAYAGNPLAVVFDGEGLSTEQMQAMAREFNLSETTFVLPVSEGVTADYRARIFTPSTELPFAGHPSIGGAWAARAAGRLPADAVEVVQECGAGLLPLQFGGTAGDEPVRLTGGRLSCSDPVDATPMLTAVGLTAADAEGQPPPRWCGGGIDFAFLAVADDAVGRCRPQISAIAELGGAGLMVFSYDRSRQRVHARVFAAGAGVPEDPATGSAAIGLGVWLVASGWAEPEGATAYEVIQGVEMGRPSTLYGEVTAGGGTATSGTVAGRVVAVAEGSIRPPAG